MMRLPVLRLLFGVLLLVASAGLALAEHLSASVSQVIRSASEYDYPPYCIVTPDNQADGFSVELLRATLQIMAHDVTFEVGPWEQVKQLLVDGKVQVLPLVGRTPEREHDFDFTFPYLTMHGTLVVRDDQDGILNLTDLKGKRVAVLLGDNAEEFLRRGDFGVEIVTTPTFEEALRQLAAGQHDAVIIQKLLALQLIKDANLTNLKTVGPPLEEFVQSFCFAVKKGDDKLLALLNEGLSLVIADGTFSYLYKKWFGPIEQRQQKSRIIVGGDLDYPPYEFLDENGQPAGYNVDLTRAIARNIGFEVDIQLRPWGEIREGLTSGRIDAVHGMFYSLERDATFDFSPAHTVINHVIVARKGAVMPRSLAELAGKAILVMTGDILHDIAARQGLEKQLVPVASQEEALRQLASGQADYALVAKVPALYWIKKNGWKNLLLAEEPVLAAEYCFAVPHGNAALLSQLSEGLKAIEATGEYRQIYARWLGVYEKPAMETREVLQYALLFLVPLIGLLFASVLWSRSLKNKVQNATAQLQGEIEERKRIHAELEEKNVEIERFLYTVSHDLKSPVVTIKGFLGMLETDLKTGNQEAIASDFYYIHSAADRITALLDDLLKLSRIGKVDSVSTANRFHQLADAARVMVAGAAAMKQVEVAITGADVSLYGDFSRLLEIWQNLLENAVKYMGEQSVPQVTLGVVQQADEVVFFVRDNGMGIDSRFQAKIFQLFDKLDPASPGTGLGLALVSRIVELYKGRIWVESEGVGKGSCFYFTLPDAVKVKPASPV